MTNFEKLKADIQGMTAEEFARKPGIYVCDMVPKHFCDKYWENCKKCRIKWLESEVEE